MLLSWRAHSVSLPKRKPPPCPAMVGFRCDFTALVSRPWPLSDGRKRSLPVIALFCCQLCVLLLCRVHSVLRSLFSPSPRLRPRCTPSGGRRPATKSSPLSPPRCVPARRPPRFIAYIMFMCGFLRARRRGPLLVLRCRGDCGATLGRARSTLRLTVTVCVPAAAVLRGDVLYQQHPVPW